jgi:hypothetical protein
MRLVPCPAGSGAASTASAAGSTSGSQELETSHRRGEARSSRRRHGHRPDDTPLAAGIAGKALDGLHPWAARSGDFVMRLIACVLATLSAIVAAVSAVRYERNRPPRRWYV